ncbi:hypothetical protein PT276_06000 [Orbaceae bacterium ESL0721]|nr:hypothetical protein [Orbaceae bacterium ESL0721]
MLANSQPFIYSLPCLLVTLFLILSLTILIPLKTDAALTAITNNSIQGDPPYITFNKGLTKIETVVRYYIIERDHL